MRLAAHPRRLGAILPTIAVAALAFPGIASAVTTSTVSVSAGTLTYTATAGENNDVSIVPYGGGYRITDSGTESASPYGPITVAAGSGCTSTGNQATCTGAGVTALSVSAGDGGDAVDTTAVGLPANVDGGAGDDTLDTGAGNDTVNGGGDEDWIDAGAGTDTVIGGSGSNTVVYASHSAAVSVTLDGTANDGAPGENDSVASDFQNVRGGSGNDAITGNSGPNFLSGGLGNDTITGNGGGDYLSYIDRTDPVTIDFSTHTFGNLSIGEHDTITDAIENGAGGSGDDRLTGDDQANVLWGGWGSGNDRLEGRGGADALWGGQGTDTADYSDRGAGSPVTVTIDGTANDGEPGEGDNVNGDIENVTGGAGADTIAGSAGPNTLDGGPGTDQLSGGAGDDTLLARDDSVDALICGDGTDGGSADPADTVASDCEAVDQTPPAPAPDPGATPPPGEGGRPSPPPNSVPPAIPAQTVTVGAAGIARVQVVCPADSGGCRGTVTLALQAASSRARGRIAVGARRRARIRIGRRRFKAKAGTSPTIPVRLSKRGRQRILRGRGRRCRVKVTTRGADGKLVVTSRDVTLRPRRQAPRRAGRR